jgi:hypothetical protein
MTASKTPVNTACSVKRAVYNLIGLPVKRSLVIVDKAELVSLLG